MSDPSGCDRCRDCLQCNESSIWEAIIAATCWAVIAFLAVFALLGAAVALGAPAPPPRPKKVERGAEPPYPLGEWSLTWGDSRWDYTFRLDGTCWGRLPAADPGVGYLGTWTYDELSGVVVDESPVRPDGPGGASWRWHLWGGEARWLPGDTVACQARMDRK